MPRLIGELPPDAVAILKAAGQVGAPGSLKRSLAIEAATAEVRDLYPSFFKRETNMKITLNNVRGAFLDALFVAKTVNGEGEPAYSGTWLLTPDHPAIPELEAAFAKVAKDKWGAKADAVMKELNLKDRTALHDGDTKADYDGFPGNMFVTSRSKTRPTVIDRDRSPLTAADGKPYSGCYCNVIIELWAQDNNFGKRINAQLKGVQFVKDGDAFGGGTPPADANEFADLGAGSDAGDLA